MQRELLPLRHVLVYRATDRRLGASYSLFGLAKSGKNEAWRSSKNVGAGTAECVEPAEALELASSLESFGTLVPPERGRRTQSRRAHAAGPITAERERLRAAVRCALGHAWINGVD